MAPPNTPTPSGSPSQNSGDQHSASDVPQTIPAGYDHATLQQMIATAQPPQVDKLGEVWQKISAEMTEAAENLRVLATNSTAVWVGQAGQQARGALLALGDWSGETGQGVQRMCQIVLTQAQAAYTAQGRMPDPVPYDEVKWQQRIDRETNPFVRMALIQQSYAQYHESEAARAEAERVVMNYSTVLRDTSTSTPTFAPPPALATDGERPPGPPGGPSPGGPPPGGGGEVPSRDDVPPVTPPSEPPGQPGQPASTFVQNVLDGRSAPDGRVGFTAPTATGGGAGPGAEAPSVVSGASAGGSGSSRPVGGSGRSSRGSGGSPGFGEGGADAKHDLWGAGGGAQDRPRPGSGFGGAGTRESAAARAAAKGRGAKSGAEFPALPEARGEEDDEDSEHQRPSYLIETEDIWGDNRWVPPPVIGEDPPDYYYR